MTEQREKAAAEPPLDCKVRLCKLYEKLGPLQPNLEFRTDCGEWVPSGIITGSLSAQLVGRYRVRVPNAELSRGETDHD